jgi:hypothetical protein
MFPLCALSYDFDAMLDVLWGMPLSTIFLPREQYLNRKFRRLMVYFISKNIFFAGLMERKLNASRAL